VAETKSLDRKLAAIAADPVGCREFILADAKDADMALGLGAPGRSPESHPGEVRFRTLEDYREQMRRVTRQGLVDIMLMSASTNHALTITERLFDGTAVTPAVRANDTTDVHLARGSRYAEAPSRPFRTASLDHIQCGHLDCEPAERATGADLGLYSVTFNNDPTHDLLTMERFHAFREEAERKSFRYFLEVFDPNVKGAVAPDVLPHFLNDNITRMLAGVAPAGRPLFLKIVYHGPKALEELVRYDRRLVVGILGGSAGTTRDAFQLLHDAQKYGARVALFGRKINQAENQLAFVQFLRLIVEGVLAPVDAVKAYHAVLAKLGIPPHRPLDDDLKTTDQSMSYAGGTSRAVVPPLPVPTAAVVKPADCGCHAPTTALKLSRNGDHRGGNSTGFINSFSRNGEGCGCSESPVPANPSQETHTGPDGFPSFGDGRPDFARMDVGQRLAYHRQRLGLGR